MNRLIKYHAIIVDLDGTLYFQRPVQLCMLFYILFFYLTHPLKWKELLIVRDYRKLYTNHINHLERCSQLAQQYRLRICDVEHIIQNWMINRPLLLLKTFRDKNLLAFLHDVQRYDIKVIIYSDYPVVDKLKVLDLMPYAAYSADDLGCLKPSPEGLLEIIKKNKLVISDCLFIGDKYEKDGKCAKSVGMDYIILSQGIRKRRKYYDMLGMWFR